MKKFFLLTTCIVLSFNISAQLAWDSEFSKDDFNNALTVISKTDNVSWPLTGGLQIGKLVINPFGSAYEDECVIALPTVGIANKLYFSWHGGGSSGSVSVYQSSDHNNWSLIFSSEGNTDLTASADSASLSTTTRYLKFAATGKVAATFRAIKVSELKSLSVGLEEWAAADAMVDDAAATKNVTVSWTNIVATVTSSDPHFSASVETIGQKNLIDQRTTITIFYTHNEAGHHSGEIILSGEGREARIAVSGTTSKYDQTLIWNQQLSECIATDELSFNAYCTSGLAVEYLSSDPSVAFVEDAVLHILKSGSITLTATQPGNYKYNAANTIEKALVIHKADPNVSAQVEDIVYGQLLQEAVIKETIGAVPGTLSWFDIDPTTLFDAGEYSLSLLFTPDNLGIYNTRLLPVTLTVNKAAQTIVWEDQQTELAIGVPVASTATLSSSLPITYAFTKCLLTIEDGIIIPENEGEVTVIAYHPGTNNYLPTTVIMQTFTILPASTPTAIEQLTPAQQKTASKYLHAGQVYLHYDGHTYDAQGKLLH